MCTRAMGVTDHAVNGPSRNDGIFLEEQFLHGNFVAE